MSHVRLAVRNIPNEQLSIHPAGLHWVTVGCIGDAEILTVQAPMTCPHSIGRTLAWSNCADIGDIAAMVVSAFYSFPFACRGDGLE